MDALKFKFVDQSLSSEDKTLLVPKQKSTLAAGFDLSSCSRTELVLKPGERVLVPTGIAVAIPEGFEGQIRSRSGLAAHNGVIVLNAPGTIDADYRGEIKVILANFSKEDFIVTFGMRIAQLVLARVYAPTPQECVTLEESSRGEGGFGSTGVMQ